MREKNMLNATKSKRFLTKKEILLFQLIFIILLTVSIVNAFGVSSPYWEGNPLDISTGETKKVELTLQNMAGATEDVTASVKLVNGTEIASLENEEYLVKANDSIKVPITIRVSESINARKVYPVTASIKTITPGTGGGVVMGTGMIVSFDVVLKEKKETQTITEQAEKQKPEKTLILTAGILLVIVIVIIFVAIKLKKNKKY